MKTFFKAFIALIIILDLIAFFLYFDSRFSHPDLKSISEADIKNLFAANIFVLAICVLIYHNNK